MEPSDPTEYQLGEILGVGKCANVYKGFKSDDPDNTFVAIKIFKKELVSVYPPDNVKEVFSREARLTKLCKHPNVVELHDFFILENQPWLVMNLVEGLSLKTHIAKGNINVDTSILLIQQILKGLENIHANGVVHGDIKPANMLVTATNHLSICDFGLASDSSEKDPYCQIAGTPAYISPEQVRGQSANLRSDLFSCGLIFFELLLKNSHHSDDLPDIYELRKGRISIMEMMEIIPPPFTHIIIKSTNTKPEMRYQTAKDFSRAIFKAYKKYLVKSETQLHQSKSTQMKQTAIYGPPRALRYCSAHQQEMILDKFRSLNGPIANLIFKHKLCQSNSLVELSDSLSAYIEHQIERIHFQRLINKLTKK